MDKNLQIINTKIFAQEEKVSHLRSNLVKRLNKMFKFSKIAQAERNSYRYLIE